MIKAITGTKDILPEEIYKWNFLENIIKKEFSYFNYSEIRTPVFEETLLFTRGIGEETDIVGKEMYTFKDRSETSITLKPEMTASVVRAYLEHSLGTKQSLVKLFYISPMFRQERPQAGRLRQFHQFGAEALGSHSPLLDVEMIYLAFSILKRIGLKDLSVKINTLGISSSREKYKKVLRDFLSDKLDLLSADSKKRYDTNILRIFDSKAENDIEIMKDAPLLLNYLDEESLNHFETVKNILNNLHIPYKVDTKLVRGLDYYTNTTFEIVSGKVGSQNALCGGGRYDNLIEILGGNPTQGVGFAAGMERILLALENEKIKIPKNVFLDFYVIRLEDNLLEKAYEIAINLRQNNFSVDLDYLNRSVKAQMREANKLNAKFCLFIGGDEFKNGKIIIKNMKISEQFEVNYYSYLNEIKQLKEKVV
ncbi:MAG: histidine--tRNA ligase [Ignavibacterium sp.]